MFKIYIISLLKIVPLFLMIVSSSVLSQITVNSLPELLPYLDDDGVNVVLAPGTYTISAADIQNGTFGTPRFEFWGSNSTYDFTGVTINIKEDVYTSSCGMSHIQIFGNNNVLKNLTMVDQCKSKYDAKKNGGTSIVMDGQNNRIEGFHVTIRGSYPYGYGDAFGKGANPVIGHKKHCACLVRGESNHVLNCTFIHRSYGHCVFMQAASNPKIEGCYIEGETRTTDDMLAEEGTGSPADLVDFMTVWKYRLPAGYMMSLAEAGIRAYNAGKTYINGTWYERGTSNPTVLNCTVKYMRTCVTLAHATGIKYVEGCVAIGCENGYSIGSGDVVNCSADCVYGPVYASTYQSDNDFNADITVLPASDSYYNGSQTVAYIGGSSHNVTLRGSESSVNQNLKIKLGGDKQNIRLLNGNLPHQNNFTASKCVITNHTNYPIVVSLGSNNNSGQSLGTITDNGSNNDIKQINTAIDKSAHIKTNPKAGVNLYLMPFSKELIINLNGSKQITLELVNSLGIVVFGKSIEGGTTSVDLSGLSFGCYFARITNNGISSVQKIFTYLQ